MTRAIQVALFGVLMATSLFSNEPNRSQSATFSMYCYWTGEATLGQVDGVLSSRIGHWNGAEIVQVEFDPDVVSVTELVQTLEARSSFYALLLGPNDSAPADFPASRQRRLKGEPLFIESKYSLKTRHPDLYYLDLDEKQAIALNSWSFFGGPMPRLLHESQLERREQIRVRLQSGNEPPLKPSRSGAGREKYRQQLLRWIGSEHQ